MPSSDDPGVVEVTPHRSDGRKSDALRSIPLRVQIPHVRALQTGWSGMDGIKSGAAMELSTSVHASYVPLKKTCGIQVALVWNYKPSQLIATLRSSVSKVWVSPGWEWMQQRGLLQRMQRRSDSLAYEQFPSFKTHVPITNVYERKRGNRSPCIIFHRIK